jgi:hypothetical protein
MQPGVEPVDVSKLGQLPPSEDEGLLDGILGVPEIAQDPIRDCEESITSPTCQAGERLFVSGSRSSTRATSTLDSFGDASDVDAYPR